MVGLGAVILKLTRSMMWSLHYRISSAKMQKGPATKAILVREVASLFTESDCCDNPKGAKLVSVGTS